MAATSVNLTDRKTLARWFWRSNAMDCFRRGANSVSLDRLKPMSLPDFSALVFGNEPVPIQRDRYRYEIVWFSLGDEQWVSITSSGIVVVPPFRCERPEDLPLTPEDVPDV